MVKLELASYVGPSPFFLRVVEEIRGRTVFHKFPQVEEDHVVSQPPRLSQDMGNNYYSIVLLKVEESSLYMLGGHRIQG